MHQGLVCVDHLFQVECVVGVMGEGLVGIVGFVGLLYLLNRLVRTYHFCAEDTASETAAVGDEVDRAVEMALQLSQALPYLSDMLMAEWLIDAHVVLSPVEMGGGRWLLG